MPLGWIAPKETDGERKIWSKKKKTETIQGFLSRRYEKGQVSSFLRKEGPVWLGRKKGTNMRGV